MKKKIVYVEKDHVNIISTKSEKTRLFLEFAPRENLCISQTFLFTIFFINNKKSHDNYGIRSNF